MSMSYDDCQDIAKEREREEAQDEIRQRLLGPIGQRKNDQPYTPLRQLCIECIARAAEALCETGHYNSTTREWVVGTDELDHLASLVADLGDIEKEGW
jgi:hypothetical protein